VAIGAHLDDRAGDLVAQDDWQVPIETRVGEPLAAGENRWRSLP